MEINADMREKLQLSASSRRLSLYGDITPRTPSPSCGGEARSLRGEQSIEDDELSGKSFNLLNNINLVSKPKHEDTCPAGEDLVNTLPSHLLLHLFSKLDWPTRRVLHLVCLRWAALCSEPSTVWSRVKLDFSCEGRDRQIRSPLLISWLNRRAPGVRALSLLRSEPVLTCRTVEAFMGVERSFHDFYPVPVEGVKALLEGMGGLQEMTIESCNDLFVGKTYDALCVLSSLTKLELVRLRKSILSHPTAFLSGLTALSSLRIACEDDWHPGWTVLPDFPPEIQGLVHLTHLSITSKGVKDVPPSISRLAKLRDLRLCGCALRTLPEEMSELSVLSVLKLNSNPLGRGSLETRMLLHGNCIGINHTLRMLCRHHHSRQCMPRQLTALTALLRLELMQCKLKAVPDAVLGLAGLQELMLGFNRIDTLPKDPALLQGLSSLRHLSLFSNRLSSVPPSFSRLQALEELFLDDNLPLEFPLPLDWVLALTHLSRISLVKDMEHIEEVPTHSWSQESLNHLLQLHDALKERAAGGDQGGRGGEGCVLRLHHAYLSSLVLRDRAW